MRVNKLFTGCDTGDVNDTHALALVAIGTIELPEVDKLNVLADKGNNTVEELQQCKEHNITTVSLIVILTQSYNKEDISVCRVDNPLEDFIWLNEIVSLA